MTGSHRKPCKGGSIFIGTDEARKVEIVRRNLRIAASGEHIKLKLGYADAGSVASPALETC
jgi:hypothetical protein